MNNDEIVDRNYCQTISELGIKCRVYDGDFLYGLADLIAAKSPTIVLGAENG